MRRSHFMLAVFLILVIAVVARYKPAYYAALLNPAPDATEYAITSVSLFQHGSYSMMINHRPYPPQYPYGFPLLLLPAYAIFGPQAQNAIYATLVYSLGVVVLTIVVGRRLFGAAAALVAGLAVAIGPAFVDTGKLIMSDAASVLLLLLIGLFVMRAWEGKRQLPWLGAAGLLAGLVTVVRIGEAAVLLLMPLAIIAMLRRSPRRALGALLVFGCAALVPIVPQLWYDCQAYGSPFTTGYSYWNWSLTGTNDSFISLRYLFEPTSLDPTANVPYYLANLLGVDIAGSGALYWPTFVVAVLAGFVAVCRNAALRRRELFVMALLVAGNLLVYLICGFHSVRYIMLTAIVVIMVAGRGVVELWQAATARGAQRNGRLLSALALVLVACGMLVMGYSAARYSYLIRVEIRHVQPWENAGRYEAMLALDKLMPQDGIIVTALPGPYVDYYLLKDTQRFYVPLKRKQSDYSFLPPAKNWPVALDQPEFLGDAIRQGKAVYVLNDVTARLVSASLDRVLAGFSFQPVGSINAPGADWQVVYQLGLLNK